MQTIEARREVATPSIHRAPRWARLFVWSFLAAFTVCGAVGIEAWPLTGFRLFSHLRHEHQTEWLAFAVAPDGHEAWLPLSRFPGGYNGFPLVMKSFASRGPRERARMCRAWTVAASALRGKTMAIRIYAIDRHLEPRHGRHPAAPPIRTLAYTCARDPVQDEGTDGAG
jgi:hypothetical protein